VVFNDESFATRYAKKHRRMAERFGREYAQKLRARGFSKGGIIDVGCGFGGTVLVLAREFPESELVGIDLSEPLLNLAKRTSRALNLEDRVTFEQQDVHEIGYDDNAFDVALNINMVHLVNDPVRMLNHLERLVKPAGFLFIADLRRSWLELLETAIRSSLTLDEARHLFHRSTLREGTFSSSMLWWKFEA
jgi:2-polyprenyl-3-methyl-5-hydroxy-6-metoxy-1,4-benzoquinol methylase